MVDSLEEHCDITDACSNEIIVDIIIGNTVIEKVVNTTATVLKTFLRILRRCSLDCWFAFSFIKFNFFLLCINVIMVKIQAATKGMIHTNIEYMTT